MVAGDKVGITMKLTTLECGWWWHRGTAILACPTSYNKWDDPALVSDQPGDRNTAPVTCTQKVYEAFMSAKER